MSNTSPSTSPKSKPSQDTPAMRQYHRFKEQHPECVLFFRMGDFYEMFHDDAQLVHKVLGVALTQRSEGVPMAGVPYHSVEGYLRRMIQAGYRVAVCEQMEDPAQAKGVVRRDVTRVVTPGTLTDEAMLEEGRENPIAAIQPLPDGSAAVAWAELSTGSFTVARFAEDELADELARIAPSELLYPQKDHQHGPPEPIANLIDSCGSVGSPQPPWPFEVAQAAQALRRQFQVQRLAGFGLEDDEPAIRPAGALVHYLIQTQRLGVTREDGQGGPPRESQRLAHLRPPIRFDRSEHLVIDQTSLRSLEIERTMRGNDVAGSLLGTLGACVTAMGKRLLRNWLCYPLSRIEPIRARQRAVGELVDDPSLLEWLRKLLDGVQDVPRIASRIAVGRPSPRDLVGLGRSVGHARSLVDLLAQRETFAPWHGRLGACVGDLEALSAELAQACVDHPPPHLREGGLIRDGYDARLDEYRGLQKDSHLWLSDYQRKLIEETGIPTLKVGFNKVFGYYIELTATHRDKAPDSWARKQTLKNAERFITSELKDFEGKVLSAESRALAREQELFHGLCESAQLRLPQLHEFGQTVGELDVLGCFARQAVRCRYTRPDLVEEPALRIVGGRHPVLDRLLGDGFVPNDVTLGVRPADSQPGSDEDPQEAQAATLALITGPNMAGKSTYIRSAALITLMAHTGGFVPADAATIGLCDRIFTRVGASDELHAGQSTFMVEMTETANICHQATPRSLVILDEIGRGTSTLDGLSLAWAIAEHLAARRCRTLFATHYHELTTLAERFDEVMNLSVSVREWKEQIVFLHRIVAGAADRSYGIHVAKLAGLPEAVVKRADEVLSQLAVSHEGQAPAEQAAEAIPPVTERDPTTTLKSGGQMMLFREYLEHPVAEQIRRLDLDALSPMQAFEALRKFKEMVQQQ